MFKHNHLPIPHPLPVTLKSPLVSPQTLLPTPRGLPTLPASSCQDNSVRDASPLEPSLGTHIRRSRIFWIVGLVFSLVSPSSQNSRSPCLVLPFLLSASDTGRRRSPLLVAYLYINPLAWPWPRERPIRASSNPCNLRPPLPPLARVPSPQDSLPPLRFPSRVLGLWERGLSFSPLRLRFPDREPTLDLGITFELTSMDLPHALQWQLLYCCGR